MKKQIQRTLMNKKDLVNEINNEYETSLEFLKEKYQIFSMDKEYNELMEELKKLQDELKADMEKTESELKILEEISSKGKAKRANRVKIALGLSLAVTVAAAAAFLITRK